MPTTIEKERLTKGRTKTHSPEVVEKALKHLENKGVFERYKKQGIQHDGIENTLRRLVRSTATDIYPIPDVADEDRRSACEFDFRKFNESYLPNRFHLAWSSSHIESMSIMQEAVLRGDGCYAFAEPRGTGKTSLSEALALWALLYGHRRYVVLMGATGPHSKELFQSVVIELEANERLMEDFPEVCYPIVQLAGSYLRSKFQHIRGHLTRIQWKSDGMSFPNIPGSKVSGSTIRTVSISGRVRGLKWTKADGESIRPDFLIIDDPQTDVSARSPKMINLREKIILNSVKGMAGPDTTLTAVMPCTVIQANDLAERFLDTVKRPEWQGRRNKLLVTFPDNLVLWEQYAKIRAESFRKKQGGRLATEFYAANKEAMDRGAIVAWAERYDKKVQLSAVQAAMDLWIDDPITFASEYQNEPLILSNESKGRVVLHAKDIGRRTSGYPNGQVPLNTQYVTAGVDIQQNLLYYAIVAWMNNFGGVIIDYGTFPKQTQSYFNAQNPAVTLESVYPQFKGILSPQVYAALSYLQSNVFSRRFLRADTKEYLGLDGVMIDKNWNLVADAVENFCKENEVKNTYFASAGRAIRADMLPMSEWSVKNNEKTGDNWRYRLSPTGRSRQVLWDTYYWKSRIAERLITPKGTDSALLLWGDDRVDHKLLADHLSSEYSDTVFGRGRYVDAWHTYVTMSDNHYWDCLIMAAVSASKCGLQMHSLTKSNESGQPVSTAATKKPRRFIPASAYNKK